MWRQIARNRRGAASLSVVQRTRTRSLRPSWLAAAPRSTSRRLLSSSSSATWEDGPFTAPSLAEIENPTAERVVMKSFMDTLHTASCEADSQHFTSFSASSSSDAPGEIVLEAERVVEESMEITEEEIYVAHEESISVTMSTTETLTEEESSDEDVVAAVDSQDDTIAADQDAPLDSTKTILETETVHGKLNLAIRTKDVAKARGAFLKCLQKQVPIEPSLLIELFNVLNPRDPITALRVLQHKIDATGEPAHPALYAQLCEAVGNVHWSLAKTPEFPQMVNALRQDLLGLDVSYQKRCYPVLLVAVIKQPISRIGRLAQGLYSFMEQRDFPISAQKLCHLLAVSKYKRQGDMSFPKVLARVVKEGFRPYPPVAIHVLQSLFPYTDLDETIVAMEAILKLQSSWEPGDRHADYRVDLGTLEHISAAAARKGSFDLNLLVWDLMDLLGYEPTQCMYENTIHGFAMGYRQDHNMLAVLGEMEERGYQPSRALIRSLSRSLRFSARRVDHAYNLLMNQETEGTRISLASLNVVLSASGELGDVDRAFATFDDFEANNIEPNQDSYSFLLEALARSLTRQKDHEQRLKDGPGRLDAASAILTLMEEKGIGMCQHCIDNYALLLFNVDKLEEATQFLVDAMERGEAVSNRTLFIMSKHNAEAGNFEAARLLASKTTEHYANLDRKIETAMEQQKECQDSTGEQGSLGASEETGSDETDNVDD